jgi:hypothetical protein
MRTVARRKRHNQSSIEMLIKFCSLRSGDFYLIKCVAPTLRGALNSLFLDVCGCVHGDPTMLVNPKIEFAFALRTANRQKF